MITAKLKNLHDAIAILIKEKPSSVKLEGGILTILCNQQEKVAGFLNRYLTRFGINATKVVVKPAPSEFVWGETQPTTRPNLTEQFWKEELEKAEQQAKSLAKPVKAKKGKK